MIDYERYTSANAMVETADRLTDSEATPKQYVLLVGGLRALAAQQQPPRSILDSYLLRAISLAGWAPSLDVCAVCGVPGPHERFAAAQGGMVCANCAPPGSPRTDPETIALLLALIRGDWSRVDAAPEAAHNRASGLVAAFAQWQLERGIRSLAHVDRMRRDEQTGSGGPR